jgi:hypothetical protein
MCPQLLIDFDKLAAALAAASAITVRGQQTECHHTPDTAHD